MIELHLKENDVFYAVIEEFLLIKMIRNDILYSPKLSLVKSKNDTLAESIKWIADIENNSIHIKYAIAKCQGVNNADYLKVIRIYNRSEVEKYILLVG